VDAELVPTRSTAVARDLVQRQELAAWRHEYEYYSRSVERRSRCRKKEGERSRWLQVGHMHGIDCADAPACPLGVVLYRERQIKLFNSPDKN
jgi:hypothetical protein